MPFRRSVLVIAGPTASGKSPLAMDAAREFSGTVINADSMQVYRELRIITARPTPEDEAQVPHRLYGVFSVSDSCSAGRWLKLAIREIEAAWDTGRLPIIVGGTGLYLKALREGLVQIPDIPTHVRAEARALHERLGGDRFREELARSDPASAARIAPADTQRLIRAYEVMRATGRPLSSWLAERSEPPLADAAQITVLVCPPRESLYAAIETRFDGMIEAGALEEVRALAALGLPADRPAMKALGIPELLAHVQGKIPLDQAVERAQQTSRQYAKRQLTWFRNQIEQDHTIFEQYSERKIEVTFPFIRNLLLTRSA